ncbi:MAG TPA: M14-type cytosolic carboxypeptidase [Tepidisphaeraceae bacterium]|nr:M14-type cytosolic carboxypeptidase [Tepidisphaeraceae bacterium]
MPRPFPLIALALLLALPTRAADLAVSTDFPGGAAQVTAIDQTARLITFKIPTPKQGGWQSWWYLKVSGITPGEKVTLHLTNGVAHAGRAVYSTDGKSWKYTEIVTFEEKGKRALYRQKIDAAEAYFAWYQPYLPENAQQLIKDATGKPGVETFELCKSEEGLPVVGLRFREGDRPDDKRLGVWIHARQHAWETGGSWAADGLARWLMSDDARAKNLRQIADFTLIPIMDVDSVAGGRGGKDQKPHDHNRDWIDEPIWAATKAAMARVKAMDAASRLDLFLDLHDPGWAGNIEFWCHLYPKMTDPRKHNTDLFLAAGKREITGPLAFNGKAVSKYALTTPSSGIWATLKTKEKVVGGTFEIGVAPPRGHDADPPSHHLTCGKQIGLAVEAYLADATRKP